MPLTARVPPVPPEPSPRPAARARQRLSPAVTTPAVAVSPRRANMTSLGSHFMRGKGISVPNLWPGIRACPAATNRNATQMMRDKLCRSDLYYRLMLFPIITPPLDDWLQAEEEIQRAEEQAVGKS